MPCNPLTRLCQTQIELQRRLFAPYGERQCSSFVAFSLKSFRADYLKPLLERNALRLGFIVSFFSQLLVPFKIDRMDRSFELIKTLSARYGDTNG